MPRRKWTFETDASYRFYICPECGEEPVAENETTCADCADEEWIIENAEGDLERMLEDATE